MESKRELERDSYSGLSQAQKKRANENRILLAKSSVSFAARGLWFTLFTRQPSTAEGCFPSTTWLKELAPGRRQGELYKAITELESLFLISRKPGRGKRCNTYHALQPHEWPETTLDWLRKSAVELAGRVEAGKQKRNATRKKPAANALSTVQDSAGSPCSFPQGSETADGGCEE